MIERMGTRDLQKVYGLHLTSIHHGASPSIPGYPVWCNIQITDAYSTDAELARYDLVALEDDKQLFPPYQGAPLMKEALLKKHPELEGILNKLASKITESQMSQMNYQVGVEGKPAAQVAREFLVKEGVVKN